MGAVVCDYLEKIEGLEARFWPKVNKAGSGGCWLWTAGRSSRSRGYGDCWFARRMLRAHRVAFELVTGPIPDGLELDHLCRVRLCVNPDHLEAVTHAENVRRGDGGRNQSDKTHCPNGHEYSAENTYRRPGQPSWRYCRACAALRTNRRRTARRE